MLHSFRFSSMCACWVCVYVHVCVRNKNSLYSKPIPRTHLSLWWALMVFVRTKVYRSLSLCVYIGKSVQIAVYIRMAQKKGTNQKGRKEDENWYGFLEFDQKKKELKEERMIKSTAATTRVRYSISRTAFRIHLLVSI